jgi:hypothetical protein
MGSMRDRSDREALRAEWRRLLRAFLFFASCVGVVLALGAIGLYH